MAPSMAGQSARGRVAVVGRAGVTAPMAIGRRDALQSITLPDDGARVAHPLRAGEGPRHEQGGEAIERVALAKMTAGVRQHDLVPRLAAPIEPEQISKALPDLLAAPHLRGPLRIRLVPARQGRAGGASPHCRAREASSSARKMCGQDSSSESAHSTCCNTSRAVVPGRITRRKKSCSAPPPAPDTSAFTRTDGSSPRFFSP